MTALPQGPKAAADLVPGDHSSSQPTPVLRHEEHEERDTRHDNKNQCHDFGHPELYIHILLSFLEDKIILDNGKRTVLSEIIEKYNKMSEI